MRSECFSFNRSTRKDEKEKFCDETIKGISIMTLLSPLEGLHVAPALSSLADKSRESFHFGSEWRKFERLQSEVTLEVAIPTK